VHAQILGDAISDDLISPELHELSGLESTGYARDAFAAAQRCCKILQWRIQKKHKEYLKNE
jgi:hypothetical protein